MRASQFIEASPKKALTPAQLRLSAGISNRTGLKFPARRSALPQARKSEILTAVVGGAAILSIILGLMAL